MDPAAPSNVHTVPPTKHKALGWVAGTEERTRVVLTFRELEAALETLTEQHKPPPQRSISLGVGTSDRFA